MRRGIMIDVKDLKKDFRKTIKKPGLRGSLTSLIHPKYEIVNAVDGVSFHVSDGEILGFIGPNGAGKSTVIKMLTGILTPTSGSCLINGKNPQKDRKKYVKDIGVVFGQRTQLWWDLPLVETYTVLKEIYEVPDNEYQKRMAFLNAVLDLNDFITSPVRTLSLGQRMRADIAASMLHSPSVLFLDEPTIGLDVVVKDKIRKAIKKINQEEGTTVILTTHDLSDIEQLCNRIVMIDKGKNVFDGNLNTLKTNYGQSREFNFEFDPRELKRVCNYCEEMKGKYKEFYYTININKVEIRFNSDEISVKEMIETTITNIDIRDLVMKDADVEEIIRRIYGKEVSLNA